jgi:putative chitobiose transport system substrate-binding protein
MLGKKFAVTVAVLMTVSMVLSACAPAATPEVVEKEVVVEKPVVQTVVVEKEKVVEKPVVETVIVEKEVPVEKKVEVVVTATPVPVAPEKVKISFMTINLKDAFADYIEGIIADYEAMHPEIEIEWIDIPSKHKEWSMANLVAGTLPDVMDQHRIKGFPELATLDDLTDVEEYVTEAQKAEYFKGIWDGGRVGGVAYGIPWYGGGHVVWWNKALFREAGLDPDVPPKTFAEALEFARVIKEKTSAPYGYSFYISDWLGTALLLAEGVQFVGPDGKAAINSERAKEVFDTWKKAYDDGLIPPEAVSVSEEADVYADVNWFTAGQTAILNRTGAIVRMLPEGFEAGVGPGLLGEAKRSLFHYHYFVVPKQSKHPKEAIDFALYYTNWENQLAFCKLVSVMPSTKKTAADPFMHKEPTNLNEEATAQIIDQLGDETQVYPKVAGWAEMVTVLKEHWAKQMLGEETTEQALAEIEKAWNLVLAAQ